MTSAYWKRLDNAGVELRPRHEYDFYPTNVAHVQTAFRCLPSGFVPATVLDAGMGMGVFGKEAQFLYPQSFRVGVELNNEMPLHNWYNWNIRGDFLKTRFDDCFDLVIGNPPYGVAEEFIRHSLSFMHNGAWLVFLLRLSFAESVKRYGFFKDNPPYSVVVTSNRPSFTGDGKTDSNAYAYFCWVKGYKGATQLDWIIAEERTLTETPQQLELFAA